MSASEIVRPAALQAPATNDEFLTGASRLLDDPPDARSRPVVAIATQHPVQHFTPGFRALHARGRVKSYVLYFDDLMGGQHDPGFGRHVNWDVDLLSGYDWVVAQGSRRRRQTRAGWHHLQLRGTDVVVAFGWATHAAQAAIMYALGTGTPLLLLGDNSWQHRPRTLKSRARGKLVGAILRRAAGAIATGTFNREDWIRLGIHPSRVFPGTIPVDVRRFSAKLRQESGGPFRIGYVGKLIPRKGVDELLRALATLPADLDWSCTLVGDGPLAADLKELAAELGVLARVEFSGFVNQASIPALLAGFDVVVVPSYVDMRVLIVAEAMAAGTPVIVSSGTAVWGEGDVLQHERTGLVYPSGNPRALARALVRLASDPVQAEAMARAALKLSVPTATPEHFARCIEHACRLVRGS